MLALAYIKRIIYNQTYRKASDMIKKILLLLPITLLVYSTMFSAVLSSQELSDIEIQTLTLQDIELSKYGYVVKYTTSEIYQGTFYLPNVWFKSAGKNIKKTVVGKKEFSYTSMTPNPILRIRYRDGVLSEIRVILSSKYQIGGVPYYTGLLDDDALKAKFTEQEGLDHLPFDKFISKKK